MPNKAFALEQNVTREVSRVVVGKAAQLRLYSGARFETAQTVSAGSVCAVTGLTATWPGQGLGAETDSLPPLLSPALGYRVVLPPGSDARTADDDRKAHINQQLGTNLHVTLCVGVKPVQLFLCHIRSLTLAKRPCSPPGDLLSTSDVPRTAFMLLY